MHITHLSSRSGSSIIVQIKGNKYVFNVFEGFQRYMIEKKRSLKGVKAFFIANEKCIPPFIGTYLTLRDGGAKELNIVSNSRISEIIKKANSFCPRNNLKLIFSSIYDDKYVNVEIINEEVLDKKGGNKRTSDFIMNIKNVRGSLLVSTIPDDLPKQYYSRLTNKETFEYGGMTYHGSDYLEEDIKIGSIMFVFSRDQLEVLVEKIKEVRIVFCFNMKAYSVLKNLHKNTFLCSKNKYIDFVSHFNIQKNLNKLSSDFLMPTSKFNMSYGSLFTNYKLRRKACKKNNSKKSKFNLKLKYLSLRKYRYKLRSGDEFLFIKNSFKIKRDKIVGYLKTKNKYKDNSLSFLGTGCAVPSKYRNVSSIMYESNGKIILFDCGEDTLNQIHRIFGNIRILERLYIIFISHSHGDHNLGVISVIRNIRHNIFLIAPSVLINFLKEFNFTNITFIETDACKILEYNFYREVVQNNNILDLFRGRIEDYTIKIDLDVKITICGCLHNKDSCSISIIDGKNKISYSGDSLPSLLFALMAENSTVLIHESTFDELNEKKAFNTKHSTIVDANYIFGISKSETLLLTHFSQRYPKGFVSKYKGIPCMDFWRFVIGENLYEKEKIDEYLNSLNE